MARCPLPECGTGTSPPLRPPGAGGGLLEDVLDLLAGLLEVARRLVGLSLGLEVAVAGGVPEALLALARELFGLVLHLVDATHGTYSLSWDAVYATVLARW